jgi:carbonic anhydrase
MSVIDELLDNNRRYAETFVGMVPIRPAKRLAVVACMDSRIDVHALLGLQVGDAHIILRKSRARRDGVQG